MSDVGLGTEREWRGSIGNSFFVFFVFAFLSLVLYSNSFNVPFLFDDAINIKSEGLQLEELSSEGINDAITRSTHRTRPVSNLSFALNYYFTGYSLPELHLTNIFIHLLSAIFLYLFLETLLQLPANEKYHRQIHLVSFSSALIWLVHPLATQSVTYLVQRMNSMASMFYVMSLFLYTKGRTQNSSGKRIFTSKSLFYFGLCAISFFLAIGSKELAITLPAIILLMEWYFFQNLSMNWLKRKSYLLLFVILCLLGIIFFFLDGDLTRLTAGYEKRSFSMIERILTQTRVVFHYMGLLIYPKADRLLFDYDFFVSKSLATPLTTLYSIVGIILGFLFSVLIASKDRLLSFCFLWFFITLSVESSIVPLEMVFEHRTYLPSMFFYLFCVILLLKICNNQTLILVITLIVCSFFGYWTYERNSVYQNDVEFWKDSVIKSPNKSRGHLNLGSAYALAGQIDLAEKHTSIALKLVPHHVSANRNLGLLYSWKGEYSLAETYLNKAIALNPQFVDAYVDLSVVYEQQGKSSMAIDMCRTVLTIAADSLRANRLMGQLLIQQGELHEGIEFVKKVLKNHPNDANMRFHLGVGLMNTGEVAAAIDQFRKAISFQPEMLQAHIHIAQLLSAVGEDREAMVHYRKAAGLSKHTSDIWYNLANVQLRLGMLEGAEKGYLKALENAISKDSVYNNLGLVYVQKEDYENAVKSFQRAVEINGENGMALRNREMAKELLLEKKATTPQ